LPKCAAGGKKYGARALGEDLVAHVSLVEQRFIDIPNLV
jgi:hypothetical protein